MMAEVAGNTQTCYCPNSNALDVMSSGGQGRKLGRGEREKAMQGGRSSGKRREALLRSEVMPPP